jgi:hypothetical protein
MICGAPNLRRQPVAVDSIWNCRDDADSWKLRVSFESADDGFLVGLMRKISYLLLTLKGPQPTDTDPELLCDEKWFSMC